MISKLQEKKELTYSRHAVLLLALSFCLGGVTSSNILSPCQLWSGTMAEGYNAASSESGQSRNQGESDVLCEEPQRPPPGLEAGVWSGQHIRSPLARAVYQKLKEDESNKNNRHVYWYRVIVERFPAEMQDKFIHFDQDEGTDEFLENCVEKSNQLFTQLFYSLTKPLLNIFMTQTSINGLLNRGSMFIFSKPQFEKLLNLSPYHKQDALLDLGAGDGMVTKQMSEYYNMTYVTEMSGTMIRRLKARGFQTLGVNEWQTSGIQYDLISCLNLLDRCDKPLSLLAEMRSVVRPGTGRLLVAVVIPFKPYVEFGSKTHQPTEYIHVKGSNFEEQVEHFVHIFRQSGLELEKFTRLPYLCEGDLTHSFYVLTDAVFLLKPISYE